MSAYAELAQMVRQPMREWWRTTGAWLLTALAALGMLRMWTDLSVWSHELATDSAKDPSIADVMNKLFRLGVAVVWFLAALAVVRIATPIAKDSQAINDDSHVRPALLLFCLKQGIAPLLIYAFVWLVTHLLHAAMSQYRSGDAATIGSFIIWTLWPDGLSTVATLAMRLIPMILVALCLIIITRRGILSWGLLGASLLEFFLIISLTDSPHSELQRLQRTSYEFKNVGFGSLALDVVISSLVLFILFNGLLSNRMRLWRCAYWLLIGGLIISQILFALTKQNHSWLLLDANILSFAPAVLLHGPPGIVGIWLAHQFPIWFPSERSLLGLAASAMPFLCSLIWSGGLFAGLYWVLGRQWTPTKRTAQAQGPNPAQG